MGNATSTGDDPHASDYVPSPDLVERDYDTEADTQQEYTDNDTQQEGYTENEEEESQRLTDNEEYDGASWNQIKTAVEKHGELPPYPRGSRLKSTASALRKVRSKSPASPRDCRKVQQRNESSSRESASDESFTDGYDYTDNSYTTGASSFVKRNNRVTADERTLTDDDDSYLVRQRPNNSKQNRKYESSTETSVSGAEDILIIDADEEYNKSIPSRSLPLPGDEDDNNTIVDGESIIDGESFIGSLQGSKESTRYRFVETNHYEEMITTAVPARDVVPIQENDGIPVVKTPRGDSSSDKTSPRAEKVTSDGTIESAHVSELSKEPGQQSATNQAPDSEIQKLVVVPAVDLDVKKKKKATKKKIVEAADIAEAKDVSTKWKSSRTKDGIDSDMSFATKQAASDLLYSLSTIPTFERSYKRHSRDPPTRQKKDPPTAKAKSNRSMSPRGTLDAPDRGFQNSHHRSNQGQSSPEAPAAVASKPSSLQMSTHSKSESNPARAPPKPESPKRPPKQAREGSYNKKGITTVQAETPNNASDRTNNREQTKETDLISIIDDVKAVMLKAIAEEARENKKDSKGIRNVVKQLSDPPALKMKHSPADESVTAQAEATPKYTSSRQPEKKDQRIVVKAESPKQAISMPGTSNEPSTTNKTNPATITVRSTESPKMTSDVSTKKKGTSPSIIMERAFPPKTINGSASLKKKVPSVASGISGEVINLHSRKKAPSIASESSSEFVSARTEVRRQAIDASVASTRRKGPSVTTPMGYDVVSAWTEFPRSVKATAKDNENEPCISNNSTIINETPEKVTTKMMTNSNCSSTTSKYDYDSGRESRADKKMKATLVDTRARLEENENSMPVGSRERAVPSLFLPNFVHSDLRDYISVTSEDFDDIDLNAVEKFEEAFNVFLESVESYSMTKNARMVETLRVAKLQKLLSVMGDFETTLENLVEERKKGKAASAKYHQAQLAAASESKAARELHLQRSLEEAQKAARIIGPRMIWEFVSRCEARAKKNAASQCQMVLPTASADDPLAILPKRLGMMGRTLRAEVNASATGDLSQTQIQQLRKLHVDNAFLKSEASLLTKKLSYLEAHLKNHLWVDSVLLRLDPKQQKLLQDRYREKVGAASL